MSQLATENQIQADVDDLKSRFTNTQELYREVATLLFFRYGIAPTANKLYQHVRKGSMTAPAEALSRFWTDLRDKSRIRIQAPGLPEELAGQAGNLVATLWGQAQSQAQESLSHLRGDMEAQFIALRTQRDCAVAAEEACKATLRALEEANASLEQQFADEVTARRALEIRLAAGNEERQRLQLSVQESREGFSKELGNVQVSLKAIEARSDAEIRRCLIEIDRERSLTRKTKQELIAAKASMSKQQVADKAAMVKVQAQVGALKEDCSRLQGQLAQLRIQLAETKKELTLANVKLLKVTPKAKTKAISVKSKQQKT